MSEFDMFDDFEMTSSEQEATIIGDPIIESEIVLATIRSECDSDEEFAYLINEAATEMALYDVIADADIATEAIKRIQIKDWKQVNFVRIAKRASIRLAKKKNDPMYAKYKKYRNLMLQSRENIYRKYGDKARREARKIIMNSRNKAANMASAAGKNISAKIDSQIKKVKHGVNMPTKLPKKAK